MPQTIPRNPELERRVRELYIPGEFGYKRIARELGIPISTVRRYTSEERREIDLAAGRAYKQRTHGQCLDCGRETNYNGRTRNGPSLRCVGCAARRTGEAKRGKGKVQVAILAALAERGPLRFMEIGHSVGISRDHTSVTVNRMMNAGHIVRLHRGVYDLPRNEEAAV